MHGTANSAITCIRLQEVPSLHMDVVAIPANTTWLPRNLATPGPGRSRTVDGSSACGDWSRATSLAKTASRDGFFT